MPLRRSAFAAAVLAAAVLAGCSDDNPSGPDAAATDGPDAIDAPEGACGAGYQMTGEYVDWESTNSASDGVEDAVWTVDGDPTRTATTAPNGRIILCLARGQVSKIRVVQSATPYIEALFIADPVVLSPAGGIFSARGLKVADRAARYDELMSGLTFNQTDGHVLVVKRGTPGVLSLNGQDSYVSDGVDDVTWEPGDTGVFTMFPNVPTGITGMASLGGTFTGPSVVPVEAGKLTIVAITN